MQSAPPRSATHNPTADMAAATKATRQHTQLQRIYVLEQHQNSIVDRWLARVSRGPLVKIDRRTGNSSSDPWFCPHLPTPPPPRREFRGRHFRLLPFRSFLIHSRPRTETGLLPCRNHLHLMPPSPTSTIITTTTAVTSLHVRFPLEQLSKPTPSHDSFPVPTTAPLNRTKVPVSLPLLVVR